jgi:hypothetical protein
MRTGRHRGRAGSLRAHPSIPRTDSGAGSQGKRASRNSPSRLLSVRSGKPKLGREVFRREIRLRNHRTRGRRLNNRRRREIRCRMLRIRPMTPGLRFLVSGPLSLTSGFRSPVSVFRYPFRAPSPPNKSGEHGKGHGQRCKQQGRKSSMHATRGRSARLLPPHPNGRARLSTGPPCRSHR